MIVVPLLLSVIALVAISILGVMIFDRIGKALARLATWFLRRF